MSGAIDQKPAAAVPVRRRRRLDMPVSVVVSIVVFVAMIAAALLAPLIAPFNPMDIASFDLMSAQLPPAFMEGGDPRYLLGTDNQGRDLFSAILYGMRISMMVAFGAVVVGAVAGVVCGLLAGFLGGWVSALIMRICDVILSFPTILLALLVSGLARAVVPGAASVQGTFIILVIAIAIHEWVQYARTVRAATMVEASKDYTRAARVLGFSSLRVMMRHILPNVMSPVMVIATINLAGAVLTEATLSFLGVGMPPNYPSLGTLIRIGNDYVFSGVWWIAVFPAAVLVILVLAVNIVGDWLRDRLNPRLAKR